MSTAHNSRRRIAARTLGAAAVAATAALTLSSCFPFLPGQGGGSSQGPSSGGVKFDDVQTATLQIEARGTFVSPSEGGYEAAGRGSGFLISQDGLAVTNNHVVAGAGTLDIWVGGDTTKKLNAKILGSSECLDLAVIQLESGSYPYFDWFDGAITTATDVYAAGFPLGDPTFTMTRGIVSKASTIAETPWASIDSVIEHDARIRGGNSGGPLVDAQGRVMGVNYAGSDLYDTNMAIHRDEVLAVLDELKAGNSVESLGINAEGLVDSDGYGLGVWVYSVTAGSVADKAGVRPGDLITRMGGVSVGTDGTLAEYCDVLRTHGDTATLDVELYRPSDELYYRGQFNGTTVTAVPPLTGSSSSGEYETVTDDEQVITVQVPAAWNDIDGRGYSNDYGTWNSIMASPNLSNFLSSWSTPGAVVSASQDAVGRVQASELVQRYADVMTGSEGCTTQGRADYNDGYHVGQYEIFNNCGGVGAKYVVVAAQSVSGDYMIVVEVQANSDSDLAAVDRVVGSFYAEY